MKMQFLLDVLEYHFYHSHVISKLHDDLKANFNK